MLIWKDHGFKNLLQIDQRLLHMLRWAKATMKRSSF